MLSGPRVGSCAPVLKRLVFVRFALDSRRDADVQGQERCQKRKSTSASTSTCSPTSKRREIIEAWRAGYNTNRPHTSLNGLTPTEFAARPNQGQNWNLLMTEGKSGGRSGRVTPGSHWYYRTEGAAQKKCWHLGDDVRAVSRMEPPYRPIVARPLERPNRIARHRRGCPTDNWHQKKAPMLSGPCCLSDHLSGARV